MQQQKKRLIIGIAGISVIVIVIIGLFSIITRKPFHVTRTAPDNGSSVEISQTTNFVIWFNKDLDEKKITKEQISSDPEFEYTVFIDKNRIEIIPVGEITVRNYTITLKDMVSTDNLTLKEYKYRFSASKNEQGAGTERYSSERYPILIHVPHYTDRWSVRLPEDGFFEDPPEGSKIPFYIYVDTPLTDSELRDPVAAQQQVLEGLRAEVVEYFKSKGVNSNEYPIKYTDPYLESRYGIFSRGDI